MTDERVEMVARAIYDAENGIDGDTIGCMIYDNHRIDGPVENAKRETLAVCERAARAALAALDAAGLVIVPRTPTRTPAKTHTYEPNPRYPWFCRHCGYAKHEPLAHSDAALSRPGEGT